MKKFALTMLGVSVFSLGLFGCGQEEETSDNAAALQAHCDDSALQSSLSDTVRNTLVDASLLRLEGLNESQKQTMEEQIRQQFTQVSIDLQNIDFTEQGCIADINIVSSKDSTDGHIMATNVTYQSVDGQAVLDDPEHSVFDLVSKSVVTQASAATGVALVANMLNAKTSELKKSATSSPSAATADKSVTAATATGAATALASKTADTEASKEAVKESPKVTAKEHKAPIVSAAKTSAPQKPKATPVSTAVRQKPAEVVKKPVEPKRAVVAAKPTAKPTKPAVTAKKTVPAKPTKKTVVKAVTNTTPTSSRPTVYKLHTNADTAPKKVAPTAAPSQKLAPTAMPAAVSRPQTTLKHPNQ